MNGKLLMTCLLWIGVWWNGRAEDKWERVMDLSGRWKFTIGDKSIWRDRYFNDNNWESIRVPAKWEDEGFNGYNGYAWYRRSFEGTELKPDRYYNLFLGYIDDVDEVYFNGHKIGSSGSFPPKYHTAYNAMRNYYIPTEFIDFTGKNVIAVRVYDAEIEGGIVGGDVGIYVNRTDDGIPVNLRGPWDFKVTGSSRAPDSPSDKETVREVETSDGWIQINVPDVWENHGFNNYDGTAWYRKVVNLPKSYQGEDLVLLLGKIDDSDWTYFNGQLVGSMVDSYGRARVYHIPARLVKAGANTLLVYVDDPQGLGGIYEGPVGLMKQSEFTRYVRWK